MKLRRGAKKMLKHHWPEHYNEIMDMIENEIFRSEIPNKILRFEYENRYRMTKSLIVDCILDVCDQLLDTCGVESVNDENSWDDYYANSIALYCNTGDSYAPTILYDTEMGLFDVTSWGDFVENKR